ncbi:RNA cytosine-C(5)-methyltransferase NSUN2-like [Styela clava]
MLKIFTTMGRRRKKVHFGGDRRDKGHYSNIVKENQKYVDYYKAQECFPESEFDDFLASMRQPLPAVFRITGYKEHAKQLLRKMKENHFSGIADIKLENNEVIKIPRPLTWYPDELAWQTNLSRTQIRKVPELEKFHNFLITETESGHVTRQESVSMIPPLLLDVKPHHKILDLCAAPGSKTAQLIEMLHTDDGDDSLSKGLCIANDKDNKRCYMLVHQINRLNSPVSMVVNHDGSQFPSLEIKNEDGTMSPLRYDRVLADVPCSGDGTMRKNTDVWKKWTVSNGLYLHGLQARLLQRGLELLATGGRIVYSTCSLNPIEDEAVVANMLTKCKGSVELIDVMDELKGLKWSPGISKWRVLERDGTWYNNHTEVPETKSHIRPSMFPPENAENLNLERCMRLLPHHQDTGGFFVAVLKKVEKLPWEKDREIIAKKPLKEDENKEQNTEAPPAKKKKWGAGFKEDPFIFFNDSDKEITSQIKSFYALKDEFPDTQLLSRTSAEKKRHIYMVSSLVRNIITNNPDRLKLINSGVRVFSRSDNNQPNLKCAFRVAQDGSEVIEPFMQKRVVDIKIDDTILLLCEEQPDYETLSEYLINQLKDLDPGSMVFKYVPENDSVAVRCKLLMSGWRGKKSARLYMNKYERAHFLNLIGHEIPEMYLPNKNNRRKRAENSDETGNSTPNDGATDENSAVETEVAASTDQNVADGSDKNGKNGEGNGELLSKEEAATA